MTEVPALLHYQTLVNMAKVKGDPVLVRLGLWYPLRDTVFVNDIRHGDFVMLHGLWLFDGFAQCSKNS